MSGACWDLCSLLFLRLRFRLNYVIIIHTLCDYPCSDSVQLGACQILRFNRLYTCVEAHWFRLRRIWDRLHRIFEWRIFQICTSTSMIRAHVWYEFSSSSSLPLRLRRASSTFPWLRRLRALPSGPTALTTGRRDRTGIFVFIWCEWG